MVKPVSKAEISSFVKGIITEASALNFPSDASIDEQNFLLNKDGSRKRRDGINFEENYAILNTGQLFWTDFDVAVTAYRWFNAGNDANNDFSVIQMGNRLDFFNNTYRSVSSGEYIGSITLQGVNQNIKVSYASVEGILVVAGNTDNVHIIKYDNEDGLNYTVDRLLVRDLWGLPGYSGSDIDIRPKSLDASHIYNLRNQGWGIPRKNEVGDLIDPIRKIEETFAEFPSNAEVVYTGLQMKAEVDEEPFEYFSPQLLNSVRGLDAPAAKGYFIIDALKRGTSRYEAWFKNQDEYGDLQYLIQIANQDTTPKGASVVEQYAGRVFFAGFSGELVDPIETSPVMSNFILFSQLIKDKTDVVKCYQLGSPTARENSDILDTDGGFIRIAGASNIVGLKALSTMILVFADNGVWSVFGGNDYGFTATNYAVKQLSTYGCINKESIVAVNDTVFFFSEDGLCQVAKNQFGEYVVNNISEGTIQKLYKGIGIRELRKASGIYDIHTKTVRWLYKQTVETGLNAQQDTYELIFDTTLGSFTKNRIYNLTADDYDNPLIFKPPTIQCYLPTGGYVWEDITEDVIRGMDFVFSVTDRVIITAERIKVDNQRLKFIVTEGSIPAIDPVDLVERDFTGYTFAEYNNPAFVDWAVRSDNPPDAHAYLLTGTITAKDSAVFKQTPYLVMHFNKTEEIVAPDADDKLSYSQSSCLIRSQWDWAVDTKTGKWSPLFQAYRYRRPYFSDGTEFDNGYSVTTSKNKLRGRGRALSIYMETEAYRDCHILGWNLSLTGNNLA